MSITRCSFLGSSVSALLGSLVILPARARISFDSDPFKLGVASGAPLSDSVVLWTRLAPKPLGGGGLDPQPIEVKWEVASDEAFHKIVRSGTTIAPPHYAHSVHVHVKGLQPGHFYWYRFFAGDAVSPVGRTRHLGRKAIKNGLDCDLVASILAHCDQGVEAGGICGPLFGFELSSAGLR